MIERYEIGQLHSFIDQLTGIFWRELRQWRDVLENEMCFCDLDGRSVENQGRK